MLNQTGNMFKASIGLGDSLLVTTNSYIRNDGAVVMGRGAALSAKNKYPDIPYDLGRRITHLGTYGILMPDRGNFVGAFQVKKHYKDEATVDLIKISTDILVDIASRYDGMIHLNYPGIGNGKLNREVVQPIIKILPDNVIVWEYSNVKDIDSG